MSVPSEVSSEQLADLLDLSSRALGKLVEKGVFRRLSRGRYGLGASIQAYVKYREQLAAERLGGKGGISSARVELIKEQTILARIAREEKQRTLLPRDDMVAHWTTIIGVAQRRFLAVPSRLYQKIRTRGNPEIAQTVVAMVSDEIRAVLNYLAKADYIPKHGKSAHMENDDEAAA